MPSHNIEHLLAQIYQNIENDSFTREIRTDEVGVSFLAGSHATHYIWLAFRLSTDTKEDTPADQQPEDTREEMTFRVIRLQPDRVETFRPSRRTGQIEKQSRFTGCRFLIGDITVPPLTQRENFGSSLRRIIERFNTHAYRNPLHNGQINGARSLTNLYHNWVSEEYLG